MNTILTDDERRAAIKSVRYGMFTEPEPDKVARAIEAAVLAKLAQQEPVAFGMPDTQLGRKHRLMMVRLDKGQDGCTLPLYTHPAPQQADRQRVPDGWKLVPVEQLEAWRQRVNTLAALTLKAERYSVGAALKQSIRDAMLAAAPEAPAQASAVDERAAITEEDAYEMGAKGAEPTEHERKLFEAWMRGHCWALCAHWDGKKYVGDEEAAGGFSAGAMATRRLWAAWRDRAALGRQPLRGELILTIAQHFAPKTLGMHDVPKWVIPFARAIENAHGIDAAMAQRDGAMAVQWERKRPDDTEGGAA